MIGFFAGFDGVLVGVSYIVSVLGAFAGLMVVPQATTRHGQVRPGWLALAALFIGGCGIWAMHFIGMLAWQPGVPVTYDIGLTLLSIALPVVITYAALYVVLRTRGNRAPWLAAGLVLGAAVATMHYTGMAAVRVAGDMVHDPALVAVSVFIAVAAATGALRIAVHWSGRVRYAGAPLMGVAVCGMHYTGMAAMRLEPAAGTIDYFTGAVTPGVMSIAVTLAVVSVLTAAVICAFGRQLQDAAEAAETGY